MILEDYVSVIFQDRGSDVSYGNSLKLLPDEFNAVSFILFILSISLQVSERISGDYIEITSPHLLGNG